MLLNEVVWFTETQNVIKMLVYVEKTIKINKDKSLNHITSLSVFVFFEVAMKRTFNESLNLGQMSFCTKFHYPIFSSF